MGEQLRAPDVEGLGERTITDYDAGKIDRVGVRGVGGAHGINARVRAFGAVLVIEAWGTSSEFERRPLRPGLPTIDIVFVESGEFEYLDAGVWRSSRGPLMIAPSGLPHRVRFTSAWKFIVARVPREALLHYVPMLTDTVGIHTELTMPERAMQAFLSQAVRSEQEVTDAESRTVDRQVLDMAGTLVLDRHSGSLAPDTPRAVLRKRALAVIAERAGDAELTPQALALAVSASLRHLQDVFSDAQSSVAAEIRRERARIARSLLQDARFDALHTGEIAQRSGFGSSASMRRALEDLYRLSPRELRTRRSA
ncbi:helix-turn-helix domain-containing protein [Leucobacter zeae]|nr:helix-turn-helix domain-containing protein [Leucobacter zeae]